jgi:hypothetical protein
MKTYVVTCTNTYKIEAATEEAATTIAHALDNNESYSDELGSGKIIDSDTSIEEDDPVCDICDGDGWCYRQIDVDDEKRVPCECKADQEW